MNLSAEFNPRPWWHLPAVVVVGAVLGAFLSGLLHLPWWSSPVLGTVFAMVGAHLLDQHEDTKKARLLAQPMSLNEDGTLHVPILLAGERVEVLGDEDGPLQARIVRPDGSVRAVADWSALR